jgi:protein-disulfide isomerase
MKNIALMMVLAASLMACSKKDAAPATAAAPAVTTPAPAPAPEDSIALTPEQQAVLVRPHSPILGNARAPVTVVEFLDPACEACRAYAPVVQQIKFLYPNEVRVVVRFAAFHEGSDEAVRLLYAAQRQGKFDTILAALFDGQDQWASHHQPNLQRAWELAGAAGLNLARAREDAQSESATALLKREAEDLVLLKVSRTPTFFVNGKPLAVFGAEPLMNLVAEEVKAISN